jgi:apolipoprotein N-acyltransferase
VKGFLLELGLLGLSAVLFALSFPSALNRWGLFPLGFIALGPAFGVIRQSGWVKVCLYGFLFGWCSYGLFNYWLSTFHPLALVIAPAIYALYFLILFPALKAASVFFPRRGYLVQLLVWMAYEYLRTLGFLGYPYGILGYTQYLFLPFIQLAEITGIWGVTALTVFPSIYLGWLLGPRLLPLQTPPPGPAPNAPPQAGPKPPSRSAQNPAQSRPPGRSKLPPPWIPALIYLGLFAANLVLGAGLLSRDYGGPQWKVALIQHNADTWEGGDRAYRRNIETLIRLSDQALAQAPDTQGVIWSETAVVPSIDWHTRYRLDNARYAMIRFLEDYLSGRDVPFLFGNNDGQAVRDENGQPVPDRAGNLIRKDYNGVVFFDRGRIQGIYRKLHLVPFTEFFPYGDLFPRFYAFLQSHDFHFWEKGEEAVIFDVRGVKVCTPICFEDVFGYLSRDFVRRGAEVIVNLTNDSWSGSVAAEMQHGAMAVFRAVENRRSLVRSTNSGFTCTVLPTGKISAWVEPFTETFLTGAVPVYTGTRTLYTLWGDLFGRIFPAAGAFFLILGFLGRFRGRERFRGRVDKRAGVKDDVLTGQS